MKLTALFGKRSAVSGDGIMCVYPHPAGRRTAGEYHEPEMRFEDRNDPVTWTQARQYGAEDRMGSQLPEHPISSVEHAQQIADKVTKKAGVRPVTIQHTPERDYSFAQAHPEGGRSRIVLGTGGMNHGMLLHELTHHIDREKGTQDPEEVHGDSFRDHFENTLVDHHPNSYVAREAFRDKFHQTDQIMRMGGSGRYNGPNPEMNEHEKAQPPVPKHTPMWEHNPETLNKAMNAVRNRHEPHTYLKYMDSHPELDYEHDDDFERGDAHMADEDLEEGMHPRLVPPHMLDAWVKHHPNPKALEDPQYDENDEEAPVRHTGARSAESYAEDFSKGTKPCPCCGGTGEHDTGFECYLCDGGMTVGKDTPENHVCDGAYEDGGESHGGASHTAALQTRRATKADGGPVPDGTRGKDSRGHDVEMTPQDGWAHLDGSHGEDDRQRDVDSIGDRPVYTQDHTWLPEGRYWGPNSAQNDQRLFDGDHLRPEVRQDILERVGSVLDKYGEWRKWATVYFAGSEAAQWQPFNGDFDVLISADWSEFREEESWYEELDDAELAHLLTEDLWRHANISDYYFTLADGRKVGPFDRTFFVIAAPDIRDIRPYAAYNVTDDDWTVHPLQVPKDWSAQRLPEAYWGYAEALVNEIQAIGQLPAEERHRMAANLWEELHTHRSDAFAAGGHGLFDLSNIVEKYLDQHPDHPWAKLTEWKNSAVESGHEPWVPTTAGRASAEEPGGASERLLEVEAQSGAEGIRAGLRHGGREEDDGYRASSGLPPLEGRGAGAWGAGGSSVPHEGRELSWWFGVSAQALLQSGAPGARDDQGEQLAGPRAGRAGGAPDALPGRASVRREEHVRVEDRDTELPEVSPRTAAGVPTIEALAGAYRQLLIWKNESPSGASAWVPTTARRTTLTDLLDPKTAADGADYGGVMIALVPPKKICEKLAQEDGEPVEAMHVTLAYMPGLDRKKAGPELKELVEGWARTQKSLTAHIGGVGTFVNPGEHVLWAAVDIPGGGLFRESLVETLERHGYDVANDHGWTPHVTISYGDHHFRFMPKVEPATWDVTEVHVCAGDNWTAVPLG